MELWQAIYDQADRQLQRIMEECNFKPCREQQKPQTQKLSDGYRVDLVYELDHAAQHATAMVEKYKTLGYQASTLLTPEQTMAIDNHP